MALRRLDHTYTTDDVMFDEETNRILRVVDKGNVFLLNDRVRERMTSSGVVDYEILDVKGTTYAAVRPFFFPNDVSNWSFHMFLDYCAMYGNLAGCLEEMGLSLLDGHPWNAVFYFTRPRFVDMGSIVSYPASGRREFKRYKKLSWCYRFSEGQRTRSFLENQTDPPRCVQVLLDVVTRDRFLGYKSKAKRLFGVPSPSAWSAYYGNGREEYHDTPKEEVLKKVLASFKPRLVYDIGCNTGHYSLLCASYGATVVGCDPDPDAVDSLYLKSRQGNLPVLPLVADMAALSRAIKRTYALLRPPGPDLALLLAVVHHLVYRQGFRFGDIFEALQELGAQMALVEMVNKKDENVAKWDRSDGKEWYTFEHLVETGRKYFPRWEVFDSHDDTRPMVLFMK